MVFGYWVPGCHGAPPPDGHSMNTSGLFGSGRCGGGAMKRRCLPDETLSREGKGDSETIEYASYDLLVSEEMMLPSFMIDEACEHDQQKHFVGNVIQ